jgi:hypothetical protein
MGSLLLTLLQDTTRCCTLKFHLKSQVCPATVGYMNFQVAADGLAPGEVKISIRPGGAGSGPDGQAVAKWVSQGRPEPTEGHQRPRKSFLSVPHWDKDSVSPGGACP